MYKVLIGLFNTKPCDKPSGNTNIGFKRENNKTTDVIALEKFHYFFSCHELPAVCLGFCLRCYGADRLGGLLRVFHFNLQQILTL